MKRTLCGPTKLLLLIGLGALTIGWYRDLEAPRSQASTQIAPSVTAAQSQWPTTALERSRGRTVPEGMRLVSIQCDQSTDMPRPGDRVDLRVFNGSDGDETLVEDVEVWFLAESSDPERVASATLLLTDTQARQLALRLPRVSLAPRASKF